VAKEKKIEQAAESGAICVHSFIRSDLVTAYAAAEVWADPTL